MLPFPLHGPEFSAVVDMETMIPDNDLSIYIGGIGPLAIQRDGEKDKHGKYGISIRAIGRLQAVGVLSLKLINSIERCKCLTTRPLQTQKTPHYRAGRL